MYSKSGNARLIWAWQTADTEGMMQSYRLVVPALAHYPVLEKASRDSMDEIAWRPVTVALDEPSKALTAALCELTQEGCQSAEEREKSRLAAQDRSI